MADRTLEEILVGLRRRVSLLERKRPAKPFLPQRLAGNPTNIGDCNLAVKSGWYAVVSGLNQPISTGLGTLLVLTNGTGISQQFRRAWVDGGISDDRLWVRTSSTSGATWAPWILQARPGAPDTGWVAPVLANGFTGSNVAYRRVNGIVHLRGELLRATAPIASTQAFVLPAGHTPSTRHRVMNWAASGDSTQAVFLSVSASGSVEVMCTIARTATPGYHISTSFPSD